MSPRWLVSPDRSAPTRSENRIQKGGFFFFCSHQMHWSKTLNKKWTRRDRTQDQNKHVVCCYLEISSDVYSQQILLLVLWSFQQQRLKLQIQQLKVNELLRVTTSYTWGKYLNSKDHWHTDKTSRRYLCISGQQQSSVTLDEWLLDVNQHPLVQQAGSEQNMWHQWLNHWVFVFGLSPVFAAVRMSTNLDTSPSVSEIKVGVAMRGLLRSLRM